MLFNFARPPLFREEKLAVGPARLLRNDLAVIHQSPPKRKPAASALNSEGRDDGPKLKMLADQSCADDCGERLRVLDNLYQDPRGRAAVIIAAAGASLYLFAARGVNRSLITHHSSLITYLSARPDGSAGRPGAGALLGLFPFEPAVKLQYGRALREHVGVQATLRRRRGQLDLDRPNLGRVQALTDAVEE